MIKSIVKFLGVCVLIFLFCQTKALAEKKYNFGLKAGYNFASHWSNKEKADDSYVLIRRKFGLLAGVVANFRLSSYFKLQPEILYIQKGSRQEVTVPGLPLGSIEVVYDLHYLEIPILLKFYPRKGNGLVQPILSTGGYFSYLLKGTYSYSNPFLGYQDFDLEGLKKTDFGLLSDLGVEFHEDEIIFGIHFRYSMGFVDLDLPTGPDAPTVALRNNTYIVHFELLY